METITIPKGFKITPQQFDQLANTDQQIRMELTKEGELVIMSPTGGEAGRKNRRLIQQIGIWTDENGTGEAFDSSTLFILPNGARRSPDVSWIKLVSSQKARGHSLRKPRPNTENYVQREDTGFQRLFGQ